MRYSFSRIEDEELMAIAQKEDRILLTRDTGIIERARDMETLFIESEDWRVQVQAGFGSF